MKAVIYKHQYLSCGDQWKSIVKEVNIAPDGWARAEAKMDRKADCVYRALCNNVNISPHDCLVVAGRNGWRRPMTRDAIVTGGGTTSKE